MPSVEQLAEFAGNHAILSTALIGSFMLLVFSEFQRKSRALSDVPSETVIALMNSNATVLDLRSAEQFRKGHLTGARNLEGDVTADDSRIAAMKDKTLVIVCDTGMVSARTAAKLRKAGFDNTFSLKGGLAAWQQSNLPLVSDRKDKQGKKGGKKGKGKS